MMSRILGIDVGGTNTKAAVVDITTGELISDRIKYPTPQSASPDSIKPIILNFINDLSDYDFEKVGVGFPSRVKDKICASASNIDKSWLGTDLFKYFGDITGKDTVVINDADAAGLAELHFGNLKDIMGTTILLTLGTGIGSALFIDGKLVPNTEFGHLKFKEGIAEHFISNRVRKKLGLSLEEFGERLVEFLDHIDFIFSPSRIVLGGGISKRFEDFFKPMDTDFEIMPAALFNHAGNVGAALAVK